MQRTLVFGSVEHVLAELDRLGAGPVTTTGVWSFAQILDHLREGAEWAMARAPESYRSEGQLLSPEVGRRFYERMVRAGKMRGGVNNPQAPQVRTEGDAAAALLKLRMALAELRDYGGPHPVHAFFGPLTREEWQVWNVLHCAHHLGFARSGAE